MKKEIFNIVWYMALIYGGLEWLVWIADRRKDKQNK